MKNYYAVGEHISADDPRGFIKFSPRILPNEILDSLQKLKEIKLFDTKDMAHQYAINHAVKDKSGKIISIASELEIFIIDESVIRKSNSTDDFYTVPNQSANIIVKKSSVEMPAGCSEISFKRGGSDIWEKEIKKDENEYLGDEASSNLKKELQQSGVNAAIAAANYYKGYVLKGFKHGIPEQDLKNPLASVSISIAGAFYNADHQNWAENIAITLNNNSKWTIAEIHKYLLQQRVQYFQKNSKDYSKSLFLKKLDSVLVISYELTQQLFPVSEFVKNDFKTDEDLTEIREDVSKFMSNLAAPASAATAPAACMFPPIKNDVAINDQNRALDHLFSQAKENPELGKFLLLKAKEFSNTTSDVQALGQKYN